ncbi:unnamed protein product [Cylindrotheca closterium]|uniref:Rhodanese domain-containing protein n=1 Tax=Cylindrotheca closterium TaxID=2856 RepID=A0AAD2PY79_9STRA|nr:unnamed protein product [Cylindrotheca closterium]
MGNSASGEELSAALKQGAMIVDVRSPGEFAGGHATGAVNYPLGGLASKMDTLKQTGKPVVFCCASGGRSGSATDMAKGVLPQEVINGGPWQNVQKVVSSM